MSKFEIYKDNSGEYRWEFKANNGETIAVVSESHPSKDDAKHSVEIMQKETASAEVIDLTE